MFKAEIKERKSDFSLKIECSLYLGFSDPKIERISKIFDSNETAEAHLVSCAISFVNITFESFCSRLKAVAPMRFHQPKRDLTWMEAYWQVLELRDSVFAPSRSPYYRSKTLLENVGLLAKVIPELHTETFKEQLRDLIKVCMMLDRYISPIVEEQRKEWLEITDKEVENEFKNVA